MWTYVCAKLLDIKWTQEEALVTVRKTTDRESFSFFVIEIVCSLLAGIGFLLQSRVKSFQKIECGGF